MRKIVLILLAVVLVFSAVEWDITQITDETAMWSDEAMITIDANGKPLIVFEQWEDEGDYDYLIHAYQEGETWETKELVDASEIGWCDFKVDSKGNFFILHTSHGAPDQTELCLTTDTSGEFTSTVLVVKDADISNTRVLLDEEENPHILYTEDEPEGWEEWIYYGYFDSEGFHSELVNEGLGSSGGGDLVITADASPHVFFTDGEEGVVWHAARSDESWSREEVYSNYPWWHFSFPSAVVDGQSDFHVAYEVGGGAGIGYATNKTGSWVPEWITDTLTYIGIHFEPCVAVDPKDNPHIAWWYYEDEESWCDVAYGFKGASGWEYGPISETPENDEWMSQTHYFVVDPAGYGHIAFSSWWIEGELEKGEIFYAKTTEPLAEPDAVAEWSIEWNACGLWIQGSTVHFSSSQSGSVHLDLYDAIGRHVDQLASGNYPAGEHSIPINVSDLAAGVYFIRAEIGRQSASVKFVLTQQGFCQGG